MKIAFSDYDGTLAVSGEGVPAENIDAIHAWRSAGNKFGIVTGRDHSLIAMETAAYEIPVDFYICCNGAALHDTKGTPMALTHLPRAAMEQLFASKHVRTYEGGMLFFTDTRAYSYRLHADVSPSCLTPLDRVEDALDLENVVQMGMRFADRAETLAAFAAIDADFPDTFTGNMNRQYLDLNTAGVNKSTGIADLVRRCGWEDAELLIIGDDRNDLAMIEAYHGFTVARAQPFMHEAARAVYDSVGAMLRDHM